MMPLIESFRTNSVELHARTFRDQATGARMADATVGVVRGEIRAKLRAELDPVRERAMRARLAQLNRDLDGAFSSTYLATSLDRA